MFGFKTAFTTPTGSLVLHTETLHPDHIPRRYASDTYYRIIGAGDGTNTIWLPDRDRNLATERTFPVPPDMPANVMSYIEKYHLKDPHPYRNCHIGAAAMTGAGFLDRHDAVNVAAGIINHGEVVDEQDLATGAHGVIGTKLDSYNMYAVHSLVGVEPGLAIQVDDVGGPLSLVSLAHAVDHYQHRDEDQGGLVLPEYSNVPFRLYELRA